MSSTAYQFRNLMHAQQHAAADGTEDEVMGNTARID
jgi:hypothetical protein